jgi:hypothetical protein
MIVEGSGWAWDNKGGGFSATQGGNISADGTSASQNTGDDYLANLHSYITAVGYLASSSFNIPVNNLSSDGSYINT